MFLSKIKCNYHSKQASNIRELEIEGEATHATHHEAAFKLQICKEATSKACHLDSREKKRRERTIKA